VKSVNSTMSATVAQHADDQRAVTPSLELVQLVKRYGDVVALGGVDLTVRNGECVTVLGPSGSGKTTLLRMVAGFASPTDGVVRIDGRDVMDVSPSDRGIGMVFQDYALFPHMTVAANVAYGLKVRKWPKEKRARRVDEMLEIVGLRGMDKRRPRELSGGQQQRVALARALAFGPELLLMDEPLGALDRDLRVRMSGELGRIQRELDTTLIYVTHDREEALTLSDRIAIMRDGLIECVGTPQELYDRPPSRFVAAFFGWHNVFDVDVLECRGGRATCAWLDGRISVTAAKGVTSGQHAFVLPTRALRTVSEDGDGEFKISGRVLEALYMGDDVRLRVLLANGQELVAHVSAAGRGVIPRIDDEVVLAVDTARVSVVPERVAAA
jgi:ABC-type Fe3+/spermidine/putrescine transport system ATPase subunit